MAKMSHNEFCEAFMITSSTGRVYSRAMLLSAASRHWLVRLGRISRSEIASVVDDDAWIRRLRGSVPQYVIEEAARESLMRRVLAPEREVNRNLILIHQPKRAEPVVLTCVKPEDQR